MKNDGGQAFPRPAGREPNGNPVWSQGGMTLRQYYAGQALAGINSTWAGGATSADLAAECVRHADALIAELEKESPE